MKQCDFMGGASPPTRRLVKKQAEYHYETFDNRMKVWVWRRIIMVEVCGDWKPQVVTRHLRSLWGDFNNVRRRWGGAFAIIDCSSLRIQTEAFRYQLKTDWEMLFNRDDLRICLIENNALRRIIRQAMVALIPEAKNVHVFREYGQALRFIQVHTKIGETSGGAGAAEPSSETADRPSGPADRPSKIADRPAGGTDVFETGETPGEAAADRDPIPQQLTLSWVESHAHIRLIGDGLKWMIAAWRNIIFLRISHNWTPEEVHDYAKRLSTLPGMLTRQWSRIYFVFDLSRMKFRKEDASRYLRSDLLEFLDREGIRACIVEESKRRRLLLRSFYMTIGKLDKIRLFTACDEALAWIREEILSPAGPGRG
jgi:hypothetical protein